LKIIKTFFGLLFFLIGIVLMMGVIFGGTGMSLEAVIKGKSLLLLLSAICFLIYYFLLKNSKFHSSLINLIRRKK
jgi:hypothetical protein